MAHFIVLQILIASFRKLLIMPIKLDASRYRWVSWLLVIIAVGSDVDSKVFAMEIIRLRHRRRCIDTDFETLCMSIDHLDNETDMLADIVSEYCRSRQRDDLVIGTALLAVTKMNKSVDAERTTSYGKTVLMMEHSKFDFRQAGMGTRVS